MGKITSERRERMFDTHSQEQMIYNNLAGQIQLGFFDDGERFPSVQEVARKFRVSYCPAQRALKALERDGLIKLSRGKETAVVAKPYQDYLSSSIFQNRAAALSDLNKSLALLSPAICAYGIDPIKGPLSSVPPSEAGESVYSGKLLYRLFGRSLLALGSHTVSNLYHDAGAFIGSAYQDLLYAAYGETEANRFLCKLAERFCQGFQEGRNGNFAAAKETFQDAGSVFFRKIEECMVKSVIPANACTQEAFRWEPCKGRTRYCDLIALDLIRKINQGVFPAGSFLPNHTSLADLYHVSPITIRRTAERLNKWGVTRPVNGIGTQVALPIDSTILYKFKEFRVGSQLNYFLEAFQLLAITCEDVIQATYSYFTEETLHTIIQTVSAAKDRNASMVAAIGTVLQALVRCCPLAAVREIYEKITLLLLNGNIIQLDQTCEKWFAGWPEFLRTFSESLQSGNAAGFAATFRRLITENFLIARRRFLEIGISGIAEIAVPAGFL